MRNFAKVVMVVAPALALSTLPVKADAAGPLQYHPLTPCRVVDTRLGYGGSMTPSADRLFAVQGVCGVPTGAQAVSLNVTIVASSTSGTAFLTVYPSNVTRPKVSTINFQSNDVLANGAIVPLGTAGTPPSAGDLRIFYLATGAGAVDVILDVSGYFQ